MGHRRSDRETQLCVPHGSSSQRFVAKEFEVAVSTHAGTPEKTVDDRGRNRLTSAIQFFGLRTVSSVFRASSAVSDISAKNSPRIAAALLLARLNLPVRAGTDSMLA